MSYTEKMKIIIHNLKKSQKVNSYNSNENNEAATLSHAFLDLEESFKTFINKLLPKLISQEITEDEINDILLDIGEEFRHIIYHIKDTSYYNYLNDSI